MPVWADDQQLEISIDGERVQLFTVPGEAIPEPEADEFQPTKAKASGAQGATTGQRSAKDRQQLREQAEKRSQAQQARKKIDAGWEVRVPVTAGTHESWSRSSGRRRRSRRR